MKELFTDEKKEISDFEKLDSTNNICLQFNSQDKTLSLNNNNNINNRLFDLQIEDLKSIFNKQFNSTKYFESIEEEDEEKLIGPLYCTNPNKKEAKNEFTLNCNAQKIREINSIIRNYDKEDFGNREKLIEDSTQLRKKRGRKPLKESKGNIIHTANDFDNIHRKIQTNFVTFLICFANDSIKSILGKKIKLNFKQVNYKYKISIDYIYFERFKKMPYSEILKLDISIKYQKFPENHNEKVLTSLYKRSPKLKRLFEQNIMNVFINYYYCNKKCVKEIMFEGEKIEFSKKTKCFYYLMKSNKESEKNLVNVVNAAYINSSSLKLAKDRFKVEQNIIIPIDQNDNNNFDESNTKIII